MEPYAGFEPQVGEILALRTFRIGPGGTLYPLFSNAPWTDGPNAADCRMVELARGLLASHDVPAPDCSCGFYAYGSEQATAEYPHVRNVLAVVACWGHVIAGTRGLRAEYCRIEALWLSPTVPVDLAGLVAQRYESVALYADKAAMLADHPPTVLDCYDRQQPQRRTLTRRSLQAAVLATVIATALPAAWWDSIQHARLVWTLALGFFVIAAVLPGRGRSADLAARRRRLLFQAVALWMVAPFAGPVGILLLRLPLIQLSVLALVQRRQMVRAASRFPADIG